ncbi:MAG TPA: 30S ribosomal protein S13 [Patescibacteria group bacterium]
MVRIAGTNLNNEKRIEIALTGIFGIGPTTSTKILEACNIQGNPRTKDLTDDEVERIRAYIDKNLTVESDAKILITRNIKRLKDISAYRGLRHNAGLPVHGQRTKTNARTKRGKKVTMGSGRKKAAAKT